MCVDPFKALLFLEISYGPKKFFLLTLSREYFSTNRSGRSKRHEGGEKELNLSQERRESEGVINRRRPPRAFLEVHGPPLQEPSLGSPRGGIRHRYIALLS